MPFPKGTFKHSPEWRQELSRRQNKWTPEEIRTLTQWYADHEHTKLDLAGLVNLLGRNRQVLSRKARELGLTRRVRKTGRKDKRKHPTIEATRAAISKATREHLARNGHPRGMLGKKHSAEFSRQQSERNRLMFAEGRHPWQGPRSNEERKVLAERMMKRIQSGENMYSATRRGCRLDLGPVFFRSRWEANYARYLNLLLRSNQIAKWEFEVDTFWFESIKRGTRSYTPDFKITRPDGSIYYVEVKGWMDTKSKTKLKRMKKYHPKVELVVLDAKQYAGLERQLATIVPHWEGPTSSVEVFSKKDMLAMLADASEARA